MFRPEDGEEVVPDTTTEPTEPSVAGETVEQLREKLKEKDRQMTEKGNEIAALKKRMGTSGKPAVKDIPITREEVGQIVATQTTISKHVEDIYKNHPKLAKFDKILFVAADKMVREEGKDPIEAINEVIKPYLEEFAPAQPEVKQETKGQETTEPGARGETSATKPQGKVIVVPDSAKTITDEIADRNAVRKSKFRPEPLPVE